MASCDRLHLRCTLAVSAYFDAFAPGALRCLRPHGIGLLYRVDCSVSSFFSEWANEEAAAASRSECDEADSASDLLVLEACGLALADFEKTTYRIGSSGATLQHFGWLPAGLGQGFRLDRLLGPGRIHCLGPTHTVSQVQPQLSLVGVRVGTDSL